MKKPKILVVGSFVMDQIVTTDIFPRQGQTILAKSFKKAPGGKGANQAVQMARLGADVTICGKLGRDENGKIMFSVCDEAGIHTEHILFDTATSSGCAVIILEEKPGVATENRIMVIPGANMTIKSSEIEFLEDCIADFDMVVLQLEIPMEINLQVARYAHKKNVPVMLNPAPSAPLPEELLSYLSFLSPNEHEAYDLTGIEIEHKGESINLDTARDAARALQDKGVKNVLITLGSAGAALAVDDNFYFSPAISGTKAVDPTAAGDSFVGAFCTATCIGMAPDEALKFANQTASLTVSAMGAMPSLPSLEQVKKNMIWNPNLSALEVSL